MTNGLRNANQNSTQNIQEGYRNGFPKTRIGQLYTTIIFTNHVLTSMLVSSYCQEPRSNYTITARTLLAKFYDY